MLNLPIFAYDSSDTEIVARAQKLAKKWDIPFQPMNFSSAEIKSEMQQTHNLALVLTPTQLELRSLLEPKLGAVFVDFASDALSYRTGKGGGKKESIAKAIGIKGQTLPRVLDATAGLGRDAFVLARLGCKVDMIERSNVVAALLADGLARAEKDESLKYWLPNSMNLYHGPSLDLLKDWQGEQADVVYLDPMFPHRKKSAMVKKEMRLFQQLLGPDEDADALLEPALALAKHRVVVKRPDTAPCLNNCEPNMAIQGKKLRFDVYFTNL